MKHFNIFSSWWIHFKLLDTFCKFVDTSFKFWVHISNVPPQIQTSGKPLILFSILTWGSCMFADKRPLILSFCLKIGSSSKSTPFGQDKGFIYLLEVPLFCHRHLLLSLHRPLYSLPLQCLKAVWRESDLGGDWGCNVSPVSWSVIAEG